ncbi:hypothetical protein BB559_005479 [Furculomyces boomerangus]|uniref:tRNA (uracil-O(2)-)-methyltransferase n=2 Tax=Harpellales TaxID=61421 RepID=A0A2T9Y8I2_9FUNG|nr:hypothetical protein BB559_005479 [Furculomyces boomerangus]PWA00047.1 hypothetical protein BB558_003937 [Smittium angustum]PWA02490.1 hypothetical protein BB558_001321 [Smittium angustum]
MKLAAEAVDLTAEKKRLEAYALYKPLFYFDKFKEFNENSVVSNEQASWRVLAEMSVSTFNVENFINVMKLWTEEPDKVYPPIEKSVLIETSTINNESYFIKRKLIPKRKEKDSELAELVTFHTDAKGCRVEFSPICDEISSIPYYYPKVNKFKYIFEQKIQTSSTESSTKGGKLILAVSEPFFDSSVENTKKHVGFTKRATYDSIVDKEQYNEIYKKLKTKYSKKLVENWTEKTDPLKHVYEDIAIASWLISMWSLENTCNENIDQVDKEKPKMKFLDLGCGNGLLVYILNNEGYTGYGVDQSPREFWKTLGKNTDLRCETIQPFELEADADWIIGNHADELVPWIPLVSARSGFKKFAVIPCCFHDLAGRVINPKVRKGESKYGSYCNFVGGIMEECGYVVERDFLRIPSTRNIVLVGRRESFDKGDNALLFTSFKSDCFALYDTY